ncbi:MULTISPECIES: Lsm family RNA-binding protein [Pyrobaculum]|uniref:Like-Sm ribonucleoprotein, core n=2 Tax=Pyrobaculum arsenaticum TaxID=121277 RepID=A4WM79_PYRAR|nr:Lsm family RNA-binding protein [Pyrobaculum arsenaticum]ABP51496.1 Like-Sm ribonucleoprotein, core [Pyrobaculum arsenaticum DSM 13514]MCY0890974.1 Lsm family RNA-binding protein [Pyrobaculum arsenaticum]NYR16535.1 Lsm family RNA-binding protein [Pyrobaculum arsenaticum]
MATTLAEASKRFVAELNNLLGREVRVVLHNGEIYRGILHAVDNQLNIVLANATNNAGEKYQRVFIMYRYIVHIDSAEKRVDLREFAKHAEKIFPGMVKYVEETNIVLIGDKVRVSEIGVEGVGPVAERAKRLLEEWLKAQGLA